MQVWTADPHGPVSVPALSARAHGAASDLSLSRTRYTTRVWDRRARSGPDPFPGGRRVSITTSWS